jgi:hypothetical protein
MLAAMTHQQHDRPARGAPPSAANPRRPDGPPADVITRLATEGDTVARAGACPGCGQPVICLGGPAGLICDPGGRPHTCADPPATGSSGENHRPATARPRGTMAR